jgi:TetR/AcrR family transcriptional regulator
MKTERPKQPRPAKKTESPAKKTEKVKEAAPKRWNNLVKSQDEQYQLKRAAVITEAARAFGHRGYQNVSLDDIANSLNVTKPALYHYIKSKQELLCECHNLALDFGDKALEEGASSGKTGLQKLEIFITKYIAVFAGELAAPAMLQELDAMRPEDRKRIAARRRQFDAKLRELVQVGIADGTIAPCDPKLAVFWFMGAINGIPIWFSASGEYSGAKIAEIFVEFIVNGLKAKTRRR